MYVQHSVHVEHSVDDCAAAIGRGPKTWFPRLRADNATEVGLRVAGVSVRKRVVVDLGQPVAEGEWLNIPISWRATFPEKLFPVMTGKIELAPVEKGITRLTVSGMYEPPLGRLGALIDEAVMHSVAEATVREVTESIASRLAATDGDLRD